MSSAATPGMGLSTYQHSSGAQMGLNSVGSMDHYARQQVFANAAQSQRLRANASLPRDAWKVIDDTVYPTMDSILTIVADLRAAGLTTTIPVTAKTNEWPLIEDNHEATVAMDPETVTDEGAVDYGYDGVVVPIIQDDFSIGFRDAGVDGEMVGGSLETLNADAAARAVAEAMEDLVLNGWGPSLDADGFSTYGLTTHPNAHTGSLGDWATTPADVRADLRAMAQDLVDDGFRPDAGGYWVYLSPDRFDHLDDIDPDGSGDLLVRDRVENLSRIGQIREAEFLPADSALMFRPSRDVIDLAFAVDERTVQWGGPFRDHFKVMSIMAPRVKKTKTDQCGIAFYS